MYIERKKKIRIYALAIKSKLTKLLWFIPLIFLSLLHPSFACGCGDFYEKSLSTKVLEFGLFSTILIVYLIPSLYFLFNYRKFKCPFWYIIIPHILFIFAWQVLEHGHQLGLNAIYYWLIDHIPLISNFLISIIISLGFIVVWILPFCFIQFAKVKYNSK